MRPPPPPPAARRQPQPKSTVVGQKQMLSVFHIRGPPLCDEHRLHPAFPQHFYQQAPSRYYRRRGRGQPEVRKHEIRRGVTAFNRRTPVGALRGFFSATKNKGGARKENDTTIGMTIAGAYATGLGGCVIEMSERGLVGLGHIDGAKSVPRPALRVNFRLRRVAVVTTATVRGRCIRILDVC